MKTIIANIFSFMNPLSTPKQFCTNSTEIQNFLTWAFSMCEPKTWSKEKKILAQRTARELGSPSALLANYEHFFFQYCISFSSIIVTKFTPTYVKWVQISDLLYHRKRFYQLNQLVIDKNVWIMHYMILTSGFGASKRVGFLKWYEIK